MRPFKTPLSRYEARLVRFSPQNVNTIYLAAFGAPIKIVWVTLHLSVSAEKARFGKEDGASIHIENFLAGRTFEAILEHHMYKRALF